MLSMPQVQESNMLTMLSKMDGNCPTCAMTWKTLQSTPAQNAMILPVNSGGVLVDDEVIAGLTRAEEMDLKDKFSQKPLRYKNSQSISYAGHLHQWIMLRGDSSSSNSLSLMLHSWLPHIRTRLWPWSAKATVTNPGTVPGCSGLHEECLFPVYLTEKSGHTRRIQQGLNFRNQRTCLPQQWVHSLGHHLLRKQKSI